MLTSPDHLRQATYHGTPAPQIRYVYENTIYPDALTGLIDEDGDRFASWSMTPRGGSIRPACRPRRSHHRQLHHDRGNLVQEPRVIGGVAYVTLYD